MSISLNDHENRIKRLESQSENGHYREELIFGDYTTFGFSGSGSLTKPYTEFDALRLVSSRSNSTVTQHSISIHTLKEIQTYRRIGVDTDGGSCHVLFNRGNEIDFTIELRRPGYLYLIYGIKFGGGV